MVATTISNSGGPGSPTELSPVTIAVRDKVIEKFQEQPLKEMNESLKMLLSKEQDEQKRLGILAARVYILRQRIVALAEAGSERVISAASPALQDTQTASPPDTDVGGDTGSEWTRLRVLDDCEVNGVRFPKTVIIDVRTEDAQRLIDSGNAELVDETPPTSSKATESDDVGGDGDSELSTMQAEMDATPSDVESDAVDGTASADSPDVMTADDAEGETTSQDMTDTDLPVMETSPVAEQNDDKAETPAAESTEAMAAVSESIEDAKESVIEAPSAAEVTAALEALSSGSDTQAEAPTTPAEESEALATALTDVNPAETDATDQDEAVAVAAELEAAAAAMGAPSASADTTGGDDTTKPGGWFEAQQNAEKVAKIVADDDQKEEKPTDETP